MIYLRISFIKVKVIRVLFTCQMADYGFLGLVVLLRLLEFCWLSPTSGCSLGLFRGIRVKFVHLPMVVHNPVGASGVGCNIAFDASILFRDVTHVIIPTKQNHNYPILLSAFGIEYQ